MALFPRYGRPNKVNLSAHMPGSGGVLAAGLASQRMARGARQPARGVDLPDWRPAMVPRPAQNEYVGPVPLGQPVKTGGMSERTRSMLGAALQGASAGIRADVGPARPGSGFAQGILKGIVGASAVQAEERGLMGKLALLQARQKTSAQIEEEAGAAARGRLPYDLQKLKASSESQVEQARKLGALGQASGKTDSELRDLKEKARAQALRELDMARVNLRRPENVDMLDNLTDHVFETYLKTTPRPSGIENVKR